MKDYLQKFADKINDRKPKAGDIRYAGFNIRVYAALIDMLVLLLIMAPFAIFGPKQDYSQHPPEIQLAIYKYQTKEIDFREYSRQAGPYMYEYAKQTMPFYIVATSLVMSLLLLISWKYGNTTPGKRLFRLRIVNKEDLSEPSTYQYILRLVGYIIASIPFGLGFIIAGFNKKKQGLHDIMAGTFVIYMDAFDPEKEKKKLKYQTIIFLIIMFGAVIYFNLGG